MWYRNRKNRILIALLGIVVLLSPIVVLYKQAFAFGGNVLTISYVEPTEKQALIDLCSKDYKSTDGGIEKQGNINGAIAEALGDRAFTFIDIESRPIAGNTTYSSEVIEPESTEGDDSEDDSNDTKPAEGVENNDDPLLERDVKNKVQITLVDRASTGVTKASTCWFAHPNSKIVCMLANKDGSTPEKANAIWKVQGKGSINNLLSLGFDSNAKESLFYTLDIPNLSFGAKDYIQLCIRCESNVKGISYNLEQTVYLTRAGSVISEKDIQDGKCTEYKPTPEVENSNGSKYKNPVFIVMDAQGGGMPDKVVNPEATLQVPRLGEYRVAFQEVNEVNISVADWEDGDYSNLTLGPPKYSQNFLNNKPESIVDLDRDQAGKAGSAGLYIVYQASSKLTSTKPYTRNMVFRVNKDVKPAIGKLSKAVKKSNKKIDSISNSISSDTVKKKITGSLKTVKATSKKKNDDYVWYTEFEKWWKSNYEKYQKKYKGVKKTCPNVGDFPEFVWKDFKKETNLKNDKYKPAPSQYADWKEKDKDSDTGTNSNSSNTESESGISNTTPSTSDTEGRTTTNTPFNAEAVDIMIDTKTYSKLSSEDKQTVMKCALDCIKVSQVSKININKVYNFVSESDESTASLVRQLSDSVRADFAGAFAWFRPFGGVVGIILGFATLMIIAVLGVTIVIDLAYMVIPAVRLFLDGVKSKKNWVSDEAKFAVKESEKEVEFVSPLKIYFKLKTKSFFLLGICLLYLVSGQIYNLIAKLIDLVSGFLE